MLLKAYVSPGVSGMTGEWICEYYRSGTVGNVPEPATSPLPHTHPHIIFAIPSTGINEQLSSDVSN